MPKLSARSYNHIPVSKTSGMTPSQIDDAISTAKDVLFDIQWSNRRWGREWYECVLCEFYDSAIRIVEQVGKGKSFVIALTTLYELRDLTEARKDFE